MRPLAALLALAVLSACADTAEPVEDVAETVAPSGPEVAVADLAEVDGSGISGTVRFTALDDAVEIRYDVEGFGDGGPRGFHVHETGDCGPDSTGTPAGAAGGHFNPLASEHGGPDSSRTNRHAGDLGNIEPQAGRAVGSRVDSLLTFDGPTSVVGKAVIVHGGADDFVSQPSGDAGPRVACGVIRLARGA